MQPWTPENKVEPTLAKALIEGQFPELAPAQIVLLGEGFDNTVYRVNDEYVFRFPRRQVGASLIETERALLPRLRQRLTLPFPELLFLGAPTQEYIWPFLGCRYLSGLTACRAHLSAEERGQLAPALARFLLSLHAISADEAKEMGVGPDTFGRLDVEDRSPKTEANFQQIEKLLLFDDMQSLRALLRDLENVRDVGPKTLVHGDFYLRHLLVDEHRHLCGVIDWGDAHIGNPAIDLTIIYSFLPPEARQAFLSIYGNVDSNTLALARFRALYHTSVMVLFSHDIGDKDLFRESITGLRSLVVD